MIKDIAEQGGMPMILLTRELDFAWKISDRVFFADGYLQEQRPPEELFLNPRSGRLKSFLQRFRRA